MTHQHQFESTKKHSKIILASGSPRRRELLTMLGLSFDVITSDVDEHFDSGLEPAEVVMELAERKASAVATTISEGLIVAADTIVVVENQVLGKPASESEAAEMLRMLSGRAHTVFSGLAILDMESGQKRVSFRSTIVHMRELHDLDIQRYIQTGEPMDKAGAYAIQGLGSTLVTGIEGDYFTVVGLPMSLLAEQLWEFGIHVLDIQASRHL